MIKNIWIKASDQPPEPNKKVLIYNSETQRHFIAEWDAKWECFEITRMINIGVENVFWQELTIPSYDIYSEEKRLIK